MILYFSATGNCKYAAQRLAAARRTAHTKPPRSHGFSCRSVRKPSSSSTVPMAGRM